MKRDGGPLRKSNFIRRIFKPLLRSAGLPVVTFHSLRHTANSLLIEAGEDPLAIAGSLELDALRAIVAAIPDDLRGLRDRAALLVGWAAALRRSELSALGVDDVASEREGIVLTIRRSKTDREGAGDVVAVPYGVEEVTCPVRTLRRWLEAAAIRDGPLFRRVDRHGNVGVALSDRALANMVGQRAAAIGLDGDFAAHSLRSGFATAAARAGRLEAAIMRHGRWKSVQVARRYIRAGTRWEDNPAVDIGL